MSFIRVKGWQDFQHYKDRSPPWIKLHKTLLDNYEYQMLPVASRALAPMLWLLASENTDGLIHADHKKLAFRLRCTETEIKNGLNPLIQHGFFVVDSTMLAGCNDDAIPEAEAEREAETYLLSEFSEFWNAYPNKVGKSAALKSWRAVKPPIQAVLQALAWQCESDKWTKNKGEFIPNPATYLNQGRWQNEPPEEVTF